MAFISLGKIDKNLIPMLLGSILCFLNRLLNHSVDTLLFDGIILTNFFISISDMFSIIPLIILKFRSKKINIEPIKKSDSNTNKFEFIYTDIKEEIVQHKGSYILLSGVIFFVESIMFVPTIKVKTNTLIGYILFSSILYYLFFKSKLYKHHYFSIVSIILLGLIIDLVLGNLQNDLSDNILLLLLSILRIIILSFYYVIAKYIMEKKFCPMYEVAFYKGLITFILNSISILLDHYFFGFYKYDEYFNNFNGFELLVVLGVMITQTGMLLCMLIVAKNYSPCHIFIIFVFGQLD